METNNSTTPKFDLQTDLLRQCLAMARHAFSQGKAVPGDLVETLSTLTDSAPALLSPALAPNGAVENPHGLRARQLASVHERLTQIVAPASPVTIELFEKESAHESYWKFLGPVPLVRRLMVMAAVFLLFILAISVSPDLNEGSGDMFQGSGWSLLMNELFLICAAGLGATFAALFQINPYITNCTFDPKYEPGYWIKFVLGLIAGFMLSELIDLHPSANATGGDLARPVLAMVGGFSATVVYRILSRLTETVESLFQGSMKETIAIREQAAQTRSSQQMNQDRLKLALSLIEIQKAVATGGSEGIKQKLDQALANLIPIEFTRSTTATESEDLIPSPALASSRPGNIPNVGN